MVSTPFMLGAMFPDFMTPEGTVLLWSLVVFFVLLALLWKFAWGPIMHALEEREQRIQKTIDDADKRMKDADARAAEYERRINAAKDEAAKIIEQGKKDLDALAVEEKAKARQEIEADKDRAKREIGLAKDAAVGELRERVIKLTGEIATKIIQREIKPEDHRDIISKSLDEIGSRN